MIDPDTTEGDILASEYEAPPLCDICCEHEAEKVDFSRGYICLSCDDSLHDFSGDDPFALGESHAAEASEGIKALEDARRLK